MRRFIGLFLVLLSLGACAQSSQAEGGAKENLNVQEVSQLIKDKPEVVVIDVRTPQEHNQGHIEGSDLINFYDPNFKEKIAELDKEVEYVIYCRSGGRSANAVSVMKQLGFTNVHNMTGGMLAWDRAGLPSEK